MEPGMTSTDSRVEDFLHRNGAEATQWEDWRWQMQHRIRTRNDLSKWLTLSSDEELGIDAVAGRYDWFVTPYYASLMDRTNPHCPIRLQAIPSRQEMLAGPGLLPDPVQDRSYRVTNRVIHKYPDRAIMLVTSHCPVLCRFCTRKHHTTAIGSTYFGEGEGGDWTADFDYLRRNTAIRDVLLTGGDPLSYNDERLERIIKQLRSINHIQIVRIGSRYPVLLPQRITFELCAMLERYHPIWVNTHFNHPIEITESAARACDMLLRHGIPVGNQSVLLRGVNDHPETMKILCQRLVAARVRPYYLYHCDNVDGVGHFRTTIQRGREIIRALQGHTTGFAVPQYIVTTDKGKIHLSEDNVIEIGKDSAFVTLRTYKGEEVTIPTLINQSM